MSNRRSRGPQKEDVVEEASADEVLETPETSEATADEVLAAPAEESAEAATPELSEAVAEHGKRLQESAEEVDGGLVEADTRLNNSARNVVAAMRTDRGQAWLGRINLRGKERPCAGGTVADVCWKWEGGMVYNFGADYVLPRYDQVLVNLILERDAAPYTGTAKDAPRVNSIIQRVVDIGGALLIWS